MNREFAGAHPVRERFSSFLMEAVRAQGAFLQVDGDFDA
jgi:hypothetical protein